MSKINIDLLNPGMIIEKDIYTTTNQLIICKNTIATENIIRRLKYFDIKNVDICDEKNSVTKEESFKIFKEDYNKIENSISNMLNGLIKKEYSEKEISNIVEETVKLYNTQSSALVLIKMIQQLENDNIIFAHSLNVGILGMIIAKWSGFSEKECKFILQCGLFHDVGKLLIPKRILDKNSKLTINEFAEMKSHTVEGYNLLKSLDVDEQIANVALLHHERIDGTGYPLQLKNKQIDKFSNISKIIAIADVYDGMTSKRAYRDAICPFLVFGKFEKEGINLFDPSYLMTFLKNIINTYINDEVLLSDGRKGKIVMVNNTSLGRPVIQSNGEFIDLAKYRENELAITKILI